MVPTKARSWAGRATTRRRLGSARGAREGGQRRTREAVVDRSVSPFSFHTTHLPAPPAWATGTRIAHAPGPSGSRAGRKMRRSSLKGPWLGGEETEKRGGREGVGGRGCGDPAFRRGEQALDTLHFGRPAGLATPPGEANSLTIFRAGRRKRAIGLEPSPARAAAREKKEAREKWKQRVSSRFLSHRL